MEKMKRMGIVGSSSAAARGGATERTIGRYGIRVMERSSSQRHRHETYPSSLAYRGIVLRLIAVVVVVVVALSVMTMLCHHHDHLVIDHDFRTSNVQGLAGQQQQQQQQQPQRSSKTATRRRSWGNVFTRPWIQFVVSGGGSRGGGGYVPVLVDAFTTSTLRRKPRRILVPEQLLPLLRVPMLDGNDDAMIASSSSSSSSGAANAFPLRATAATSSSLNKKRRCDRASSGEGRHHRYHHHNHHHRHHHHQYPPHRHHHHHPSSHVVGKTVAAISTRAADVVSTCNIKRNHNALHIHQDAAEKPNKNKLQLLLSSSSTSRLIEIPPPPPALAVAEQVVSSSTYFDDHDDDRLNINGSNRCSATVAASSASSSFGARSASAAMAAAVIARSDTAALQRSTPTRMTSSSSSSTSSTQQQQQQQITAPDELLTNEKYDVEEDENSRITTTTTVTTVTTTTTTTTTTTHNNNRGRKKIERWKDMDDHDNSATMDVTPLLLDLDRSNKNGATEAAAFTGTSSSSGIIVTTTSMPSLAAATTTTSTTATATSTLQPGNGSGTTGLRINNVVKDLPAPKLELPPPPPPPPPSTPPRRSKFKMDHLLLYRRSSMREATAREGRVPYGEESRQYRRTLFDHDDWIEHRNSKRIMSNLTGMFYSGIIRQLREEVALVVGFASLLVLWNGVLVPYVDDLTTTASATAAAVSSASVTVTAAAAASMWTWKLPHLSLPSLPFQLSSPALGLLLVFRTNASFSRWTDAGTTWARIVAQSRNMVRMAATFTDMADPMQSATVHRLSQATWLYCRTLMHQLSGPTDWQDYREEIMATYSCSDDNISNNMNNNNNNNNNTMSGSETATRTSSALTRDQRMLQRFLTKPETASDRTMTALAEVSLALDAVPIDEKRRVEIDKAVILLGEFTTLCDRIYTNPVPLVYTRHTARFLSLWMLLLPCALYENFARAESFFPVHGFMVIPAAAAVAVFLFGIEELAVQLEEPFSVLPMQKFCDDVRDANHVLLDWCTESALLARQEGVDDDDDDAARQQQTAQATAFLNDAYASSHEEIPRPSIRGTTVLEPNPVAAAFFQDGDDVMPGGKVNGQHRLQPE